MENEDSSDSTYTGRESTPSSDASAEQETTSTPKRDYLVSSNSTDAIELESIDRKWILQSGYDLSTHFLRKRNQLVAQCAECTVELKMDEEMAINGIILLDDDRISNLTPFQQYEEACKEMKDHYSKDKIDDHNQNQDIFNFAKVFLFSLLIDLIVYQ